MGVFGSKSRELETWHRGHYMHDSFPMESGLKAQQRTQLHVRWVHSEAQLANTLTTLNGGHELEMFYRMNHAWRIVEDPAMRSARRRKAQGLPPLDIEPEIVKSEPEDDSEEIECLLCQDHTYFL